MNAGAKVFESHGRSYLYSGSDSLRYVNEMHALYDKHHKVSSFLKSHQNTHNSVKYEVLENSPKKARADWLKIVFV